MTIGRIVLVLMVLAMTMGCDKQTDIVARVGNTFIYSDQVSEQSDALENAVEKRVKLLDAYRENLQSEPDVLKAIKREEKRQLFYFIANREISQKVITDQDVRRAYERALYEVKIRHIFLPKILEADKAEAILVSVRQRLLRGENIFELAKSFSQDSLTMGNGGDLGFVKYGDRGFGDRFYDRVMSMPVGHISGPIESQKGYHVVKLEKRRKVPQPPFETHSKTLRRRMERNHAQELSQAFQRFVEGLKKTYQVEVENENLKTISSTLRRLREKAPTAGTTELLQKADSLSQQALLSYEKGQFTLANLGELLQDIPRHNLPPLYDISVFEEFLDRAMPFILISKYGYENCIHKEPQFRRIMQPHIERILIDKISRKKVDSRIRMDEKTLRAYHEEIASEQSPSFEEARDRISREYRQARREELSRQWMTRLKAITPVVYYKDMENDE